MSIFFSVESFSMLKRFCSQRMWSLWMTQVKPMRLSFQYWLRLVWLATSPIHWWLMAIFVSWCNPNPNPQFMQWLWDHGIVVEQPAISQSHGSGKFGAWWGFHVGSPTKVDLLQYLEGEVEPFLSQAMFIQLDSPWGALQRTTTWQV